MRTTAASAADLGVTMSGPMRARSRNVRLTDRKLVEMAVQTASAVDWTKVVRQGDDANCSGVDGDNFKVTVTKTGGRTVVTACGDVVCSVAEVRSVLLPLTSEAYAATMRELFGSDFIYGKIVHQVGADTDTVVYPQHPVRQRRAGVAVTTNTSEVDVRTITFAKRHLLTRSEEWCYVAASHTLEIGGDDSDEGFAVSMTSLHPDDVFEGKTKASVSAHTDSTVIYTVRRAAQPATAKNGSASASKKTPTRYKVQVTFRAEFGTSGLSASKPRHMPSFKERMHIWHSVSERALLWRLKDMAANIRQIERVVRRRRLGAQVFVDTQAMTQSNSRCSCCAKMLTSLLGRNKTQCHLCGFYVCEPCSRQEEVERGRIKRFIVRICEHCMERVDDAIYDDLPSDLVSSPVIVPDPQSDCNGLGQLLQNVLLCTPDTEKSAVRAVIRTMAEFNTPTTSTSSIEDLLEDTSSDDEYLEMLKRLSHEDASSRTIYALANASKRNYSIQYKPDSSIDSVPEVPIPADEDQRLRWVHRTDLARLKNLPELELICDMARKELGCSAGLVTVGTHDEIHVLASNVPAFQNFVNSRDNAICSHVLMNQELPVLLLHPEADVRFSRHNVVRDMGTRFYFGFPLTAADGTAIGTVCCLDSQSHSVSESQYRMMERFARSASKLVQYHARDK